jgi:uncharacterized protein YjdB
MIRQAIVRETASPSLRSLLPFFLSAMTALAGCAGSSTSSATVSAIGLSPAPCGVSRTNSVQMSALATMSNGSKQEVTSGVTWTSANTNTATVNATGIVVGVNPGITAITATYQGATGTLNCTVGP